MSGYDAVVVGAGISGAVFAERMASQLGYRVLVLEQRDHVAGNCHDQYNDVGLMIHTYGPHIFHTRHPQVWDYLRRYTHWRPYVHRVLGEVDGQLIPIPFNLKSLRMSFDKASAEYLEKKLLSTYGEGARVPILTLREAQDEELNRLADYIYEKIFVNYTSKQWGCRPEEISSEVTARVPVVLSEDDRYFQDEYQAIPTDGYTKLIAAMLDQPTIEVGLSTPMHERVSINEDSIQLDGMPFEGWLIYTGMIDELFDYRYGELPYRSLLFQFETLKQRNFQPVATVNYPNVPEMTRITEFKHLTGQSSGYTTIVREYPQNYDRNNELKNVPYYPVFSDENLSVYERYAAYAKRFSKLICLGRLGEYRYQNMDDAVANALHKFNDCYFQ